jgi:hypothetical protein
MKNGGNQQSEGNLQPLFPTMPTITKTACVLYDDEQHILPMRRVSYDTRRGLDRFKKAGIPSHNASRLAKGE